MKISLDKNILIYCTTIIKKLEIQALLHSHTIPHNKAIKNTVHNLIQHNQAKTNMIIDQFQIDSKDTINSNHSIVVQSTASYTSVTTSHKQQFFNHLITLNKIIDTVLQQTIQQQNTNSCNTTIDSSNKKQYSQKNIPISFTTENQYLLSLTRIFKATIDGYVTNNRNTIAQCITQLSNIGEYIPEYNKKKSKQSQKNLLQKKFIPRLHMLLLQIIQSI